MIEIQHPDKPEPMVLSDNAVHLLRNAIRTNLVLSQMADHKASMLLGASFVVFTITIGQASHGQVDLSLVSLAVFAFLAATFGMLAILPATGVTRLDKASQHNILFFGTFALFSEDEFFDQMVITMSTDANIVRAMLRDLYQSGLVLKRKKYRYLKIGCLCLLAGMVTTAALFVAERVGLVAL